jgi:hypothetical protein
LNSYARAVLFVTVILTGRDADCGDVRLEVEHRCESAHELHLDLDSPVRALGERRMPTFRCCPPPFAPRFSEPVSAARVAVLAAVWAPAERLCSRPVVSRPSRSTTKSARPVSDKKKPRSNCWLSRMPL